MGHIALYRAWRPQTFQDVVGQEHITKTLQNALKENKYSHAYLFSGPRGTGKTSAAKIFAKAVNCENGPAAEPCNTCHACLKITEGAVMDVVEIDAASNRGVEEIRDIREQVKYAPTEVRSKVYIIDEVHMLTTEAFNALLKTLEEPPARVVFILATTEPHRLPATIISRCQRFDFRRVELQSQVRRIQYICEQEAIEIEPEAVQIIARLSDGGMRDALSLLDQIIAYTDGAVTYDHVIEVTGGIASEQFEELAAIVRNRDVGEALLWIDKMLAAGKSADKCIENLIQFYRDLLIIKTAPNAAELADAILDIEKFKPLAESYTHEELFQTIDVLNRYESEMKYAGQPQTLFEVAVMKICTLNTGSHQSADRAAEPNAASPQRTDGEWQALLNRVSKLEQQLAQLSSGAAAPVQSGTDRQGQRLNTIAPRRSGVTGKFSKTLMNKLKQEQDAAIFKDVSLKWAEVLGRVKDRKITVHAWLVDGEPVMAGESFVLVAFKNTIHRETTDKPANKQLIEQILQETFHRTVRLETIMRKEWEAFENENSEASPDQAPELLQLEPQELPNQPDKYEKDWINEAIQLFGENLVTVQKERKGDGNV